MKQLLILLVLFVAACSLKHERYRREAAAFPDTYIGHWEALLSGNGSQVFQAGVTVEPSGDSLLWSYFSRLIDTTTRRVYPCGAQVKQMPLWWDDSLQVVQANHGVGQGYGFDQLHLTGADQLQMNSFSLASTCQGPFGMNATQLTFSKVNSFRFNP